MTEKAFKYIEENWEKFKKFWIDISNIESPSYYKKGVDETENFILNFADELGFKGKVIPFENAGNSLEFIWNEKSSKSPVLLMAHMDTVHKLGSFPEPKIHENDGKLFGPGVFDCKGGIAIALLSLSALANSGYNSRPIKIFFTGDEEVGHFNSDKGNEIAKFSRGCAALFNLESAPIDGRMSLGRKSATKLVLNIKGIGAHSGNDPEKGRSAILEAAYKIIDIQKLDDIFGTGTVINSALIEGGTVPNAIPENCKLTVSIRYKDLEDAKLKIEKIREIAAKSYVDGTHTKIEGGENLKPPMIPNDKNQWVFEQWKKSTSELGFENNTPYLAGGGSDAQVSYLEGIPVLDQAGTRGEFHHTTREYALIKSLPERSKMLAKTIIEFSDEDFKG